MSNALHKVAESFSSGRATKPEDFISRLTGNKSGSIYAVYSDLTEGQKAMVGHKTGDTYMNFCGNKLQFFRVNSDLELVKVTIG